MTEGYKPQKESKVEKSPKTESLDATFVKGQLRELKKFSKLPPGRSVYEDLTRRLLRADERKASSATPEQVEPLLEAINHGIAECLQKQINGAIEDAKTNHSKAKHGIVNFEVQLCTLKLPLEPHVGQTGMPEKKKPSPLKFSEKDRDTLFSSAESLSDSLYELPEVAGDPALDAVPLPAEISRERLVHISDRMRHVLAGRGVLGFHRYDELKEMLVILEKTETHADLHKELRDMAERIPAIELETLFADVLPKAQYWQNKQSIPNEEATSRSSDRNLRDTFVDTFIEWRTRKALPQEVLEKNKIQYEQLQNAFGTVRNNIIAHDEYLNVPPLA